MASWRSVGAVASAAVVLLGGCSLVTPVGGARSEGTPTVEGEPAPEPSPRPTVTVTPPPPPAVPLSDQALGPVSFSSPTAYGDLVAVLGEPTQPLAEKCHEIDAAEWGGLGVYFHADGTVYGWSLSGGPLPDQVLAPQDVYPGDYIHELHELGAATRPDERWGADYVTSVGRYVWWSESDSPDSAVSLVEVNNLVCAD